ncbi:Na+/H+ antiporter NhaA [uncultured Pelagimonas sp.]|uniref:Na+/H+ antiporter NhaA n=1 Tax=uncultured Pelagimonas sp. TaxID=1618102 RepID=UPI0026126867|nr:Na+/H+ antiporter NhaA [uncultured Pelagimonas sp.]
MTDRPASYPNQDRDLFLGDVENDGRAELVWYVDFTDPLSGRIRDVMRRTVERFGRGKATLAIRFLPSQDATSGAELAARAGISAHRQGRLTDMNGPLFELETPIYHEHVVALARELELDIEQFEDDLFSQATDAQLQEDRETAEDLGVTETPTLFIDGREYLGAWDELSLVEAVEKPIGVRISLASTDFFHWAASAGFVLVLATLCALFIANIGWHEAYEHLRETIIGIKAGGWSFDLSLEAWINDGLMSLFFLLVGIEIKREMVDGELSDMQRAALPIMGAIGGMVVPAGIYLAINWGLPTEKGWGIPMATDIAFTLGIMALLGDRVPTSLKVFISALAIADDLGAILVIAVFYGHGFDTHMFAAATIVFAIMLLLNRGRVYSRIPYLFLMVLLWYFIHESGLHATLAGVLTAAAIPSRRSANIDGIAAQTAMIFQSRMTGQENQISHGALNRLQEAIDRLRDPGFHLQNALEHWSNFMILPLFAFFNTGILIFGSSFSATAPESLGVILGLVIGKPLGIFLIVFVAVKLGIAHMSSEISWSQLIGAGFLAGVGFTMSIFIGSAAFEGAQLESVKLAILIASALAAVIGSIILIKAAPSER